jgi:hypothetical protein
MNYILYLFTYHIKNNKHISINSYKHNTGRDDRFIENTKSDDLFINKLGYDDRFINDSDLNETLLNKCDEDLEKQYILKTLESNISIIHKKIIAEEYLKYNKNLYYDLFLGLDYF